MSEASNWDQWSRWPGETERAFYERIKADYRAMADPVTGWVRALFGQTAMSDGIGKHGATDIAVRVEPERVRIIYWTPQTEPTQ